MAKLSRKRSIRLSFLASKLALSYDQDERMALLTELLDELGIDPEQREDSKESAARHIRYMVSRKRKNEQAAKRADDIDSMNRDDLRAYIQQLLAKRDRLLAEREKRPDIDAMTDEQRREYQDYLMGKIARKLEPTPSTPEPTPTVEEAPTLALPTKCMKKAVAAFDDMSDSEQLDALRGLWGES